MLGGSLRIAPDWREALLRADLDARALLAAELGRVTQRKPGREVRRVEIASGRPALYVKRIRIAGLSRRLSAWLRGDPATREARELERVRDSGVRAARPVAYGGSLLGRTFVIVTEEVCGAELTSVLESALPSERRRLLRALGVLLARLHGAGIYDEVRCKDVIVSEDGALTLIDRDPKNALPRLACAEHGALLCLARCDYLRLRGGATITSRDRLRVLASYCRASGGKYALASALPIVGAALDAELVRHRANGALVAEFGLLER